MAAHKRSASLRPTRIRSGSPVAAMPMYRLRAGAGTGIFKVAFSNQMQKATYS
jgi:hypothetical protein